MLKIFFCRSFLFSVTKLKKNCLYSKQNVSTDYNYDAFFPFSSLYVIQTRRGAWDAFKSIFNLHGRKILSHY